MKVTVFSTKDFEIPYLEKANNQKYDMVLEHDSLNEDTISKVQDSEAIITFPNDKLNPPVLDKLKEKGVKYITTRSAGTDHIDLDYAREKGFKLANAAGYSPNAIAEHAIGLMLLLSRKYHLAYKKVEDHDFRLKGLVGSELNKQTVGILGAGKIGAVAAKILHGFGSKTIIYDPVKNNELIEKYNVQYVDVDTLCKESDIISIHAPLNEKTKHLLDNSKFNLMKKGVMIINAGRGGIIKTDDLIKALKDEKVGSAGLDVYENEKGLFFYDHTDEPLKDEQFAYLQANKNVFITAHQAFTTDTALSNMNDIVFETLKKWEQGKEAEYEL